MGLQAGLIWALVTLGRPVTGELKPQAICWGGGVYERRSSSVGMERVPWWSITVRAGIPQHGAWPGCQYDINQWARPNGSIPCFAITEVLSVLLSIKCEAERRGKSHPVLLHGLHTSFLHLSLETWKEDKLRSFLHLSGERWAQHCWVTRALFGHITEATDRRMA